MFSKIDFKELFFKIDLKIIFKNITEHLLAVNKKQKKKELCFFFKEIFYEKILQSKILYKLN